MIFVGIVCWCFTKAPQGKLAKVTNAGLITVMVGVVIGIFVAGAMMIPVFKRLGSTSLYQGNGYSIAPPITFEQRGRTAGTDMFCGDGRGFFFVRIINYANGDQDLERSQMPAILAICPDAVFSSPQFTEIAGRDNWVHYTANGTNRGRALTYDVYTYSGAEGTYQLCGFYARDAGTKYAPITHDTALSFRFR